MLTELVDLNLSHIVTELVDLGSESSGYSILKNIVAYHYIYQ